MFESVHHSEEAREMMQAFYVGQYVDVSIWGSVWMYVGQYVDVSMWGSVWMYVGQYVDVCGAVCGCMWESMWM